jgi:hypothetical protein
MGTNYYAKVNHCKECDRFDEVHIGKQSFGWAFIFNPLHCTKEIWEKELKSKKISIINEYGEKISKKAFWKMVEENKDKTNIFTYIGERNRYEENPEQHEYIDPQGYRFSKSREFF